MDTSAIPSPRPQRRPLFKRLALVSAVAASLGLSGCTTLGPDFSAEQTEASAQVSDAWLETNKQLRFDETQAEQWWTAFNEPRLNRLIETAYHQNLTLQAAGLRILQARAALGIAVGAQFPQTQAAAGGVTRTWPSENINPTKNLPSALRNGDASNNYNAGFNASWEADFWGKFRRNIESSDASLMATVSSYDDVLVTLIGDIAATYVNIRTQQERLEVARDNIKAQRRSLHIANVRFENGATTELDVQQARALLYSTEASIPALENQIQQGKNALSVLLGMPPSKLETLVGVGKIPTAPASVAVGVPADLLRRRPDIRSAEQEAHAQSALIGVAEADLYPSFGLTGSLGASTAAFSRILEADSIAASAGFGFNWNILNYGRIKNNVRIQDALYQQALVNYRNTVLQAAQEVENGLVGYIKTGEQAKFLGKAVKASSRSVQLSLIQYRDGATDYQRVINSQQDLLQRQDQLVVARGNLIASLVDTYRALGGGWQIRDGQDVVPASTREQMGARTDWGTLLDPQSMDAEQRNKVAW